jgi:hypothetical protein
MPVIGIFANVKVRLGYNSNITGLFTLAKFDAKTLGIV